MTSLCTQCSAALSASQWLQLRALFVGTFSIRRTATFPLINMHCAS
jgi:hypothetical protein